MTKRMQGTVEESSSLKPFGKKLEQKSLRNPFSVHLSLAPVEETQQRNERLLSLATALEELVQILDTELDQYRELLHLLRAQRQFFSAGDIGSFEEASKRQETMVLKIKTLEEARKSVVTRLAHYFDIPSADASGFTLAKLAELMEAEADARQMDEVENGQDREIVILIRSYSERCAAYQKEILSLIRELGNLKESNAYLIQHALHHVTGVLRIFASAHATDSAYSNGGQIRRKTQKGKYVSGWG